MNVVRDYVCLCILLGHFNSLTGSHVPVFWLFGGVGSFFALSGFLAFPSYEYHASPRAYFRSRAVRLLPQYILVVLCAAFLLVCLSVLPPWDYFTSSQFYRYLGANLSFLNFLGPSLPGVFTEASGNLSPQVNGSLWTMKCEVMCCLSVPLIFAALRRRQRLCAPILSAVMITCLGLSIFFHYRSLHPGSSGMFDVLERQFVMCAYFFAGALINFYFRSFMKHRWRVLAVVLVFSAICFLWDEAGVWIEPLTDSAFVLWCSLVGGWGRFMSRRHNLSYEVYLFHCPVIQVLVATGVYSLLGNAATIFLAVVICYAAGYASWKILGRLRPLR